MECFNASDAMVSDVSAMVSDYPQSGNRSRLSPWGAPSKNWRWKRRRSTVDVIEGDRGNLDQALDNLLIHDPQAAERGFARLLSRRFSGWDLYRWVPGHVTRTDRCSRRALCERPPLRVAASCRRRFGVGAGLLAAAYALDGDNDWGWCCSAGLALPLRISPYSAHPGGLKRSIM